MRIASKMLETAIVILAFFISECCKNFFQRWKRDPKCLLPMADECYFTTGQTGRIEIAREFRKILLKCDKNPIDRDVLVCLHIINVLILELEDCELHGFKFGDFLANTPTEQIMINYLPRTWRVKADFFCENVTGLKKFSLSGAKEDYAFSLRFSGNLETMILLKVKSHRYRRFSGSPFQYLTSIKKLIFKKGVLDGLEPYHFYGLTKLRKMDLSWNHIRQLKTDVFKALESLDELRLTGNHLASFTSEHLQHLPKLSLLHIGSIERNILQSDLFKHSPSLIEFDTHDTSQLIQIPAGLFHYSRKLEVLNASHCDIVSLEEKMVVSYLRSSSEQHHSHKINREDDAELRQQVPLQKFMSHSYQELLSQHSALKGLSSLRRLDLSYNKLLHIPSGTFNDLEKLEELYLSHNPLAYLPPHLPFGPSKRLRIIKADHCKIELDPGFHFLRENFVDIVDLSHNLIRVVSLPISSNKRTIVSLDNNEIETIRIDRRLARCSSVHNAFYRIENNKINCSCKLLEFIRFIQEEDREERSFARAKSLRCSGSGNSISSVDVEAMDCPIQCFSSCSCTVRSMNCSGRQLTDVPPLIPRGVETVDLSNNKIQMLSDTDDKFWGSVSKLYLSNNSLNSLKRWVLPSSFNVLALDGNRLSSLSQGIMESINSSEEFSLYLGRNDWKCDCESVLLKKWFMHNKDKIKDAADVRCSLYYFGTTVDALFANIPVEHFCLASFSTALIICIIILACFLTAVFVFVYYSKFTILSLLYNHNLFIPFIIYKAREMKYDSFLCYTAADEAVASHLLEHLEPTHLICVPDRDWPSRNGYHKNLIRTIMNSRTTLLLVSEASLECEWFRNKFKCAHSQAVENRMHRLIIVTIGSIDISKDTDDDLRKFVASQRVINLGERWFWQKLNYSLSYLKV